MNFTRNQLHKRHLLSHQQVDGWLGEHTGNLYLNEKLKQLQRVKMFMNVSELLHENGISFINIKGPLLSHRIYGDATVRISRDVDILIDFKDIEHVIEILFKNGYQLTESAYWPEKKAQQELLVKIFRHLSFINPSTNSLVEIHWVLKQFLPVSRKTLDKVVKENLMEIEVGGQKHVLLSKEFELLYLMIHGSEHRWECLKWLVDIKDYPINDIDLNKFNRLMKQFRAERIVAQTNFLLQHFFDKKLPFQGNKKSAKKLIKYSLRAINGPVKTDKSLADLMIVFMNKYYMFPGISYKRKIILDLFFRRRDLQVIDSSSKLVYFLYRPYSLIKRWTFRAG